MNGLFDNSFQLLVGFGTAHIMIAGIVLGLVGALASAITWIVRGRFAKALASLALLILVPMAVLGIIPGMEAFDVPLALGLLVLSFYLHIRPGEDRTKTDIVLAIMLGVALLAFVVVQALAVISAPPSA